MSAFSRYFPAIPVPCRFIPREIPAVAAPAAVDPLPASYEPLPDGRAFVTIGGISSPYASATAALAYLKGQEAAGRIRLAPLPPC